MQTNQETHGAHSKMRHPVESQENPLPVRFRDERPLASSGHVAQQLMPYKLTNDGHDPEKKNQLERHYTRCPKKSTIEAILSM